MRDVRTRLKALGATHVADSGGTRVLDGSEQGGRSSGGGAAGDLTIGLATLAQLRNDGGAAVVAPGWRGGSVVLSVAAMLPAGEQLAEALALLTPAEALVHECLLAAGVDFCLVC